MEKDSKKEVYNNDGSLEQLSRSSRNSKLYKQVDSNYDNLDNLPLEDNTDEIDMDSLKKLLSRTEKKSKSSQLLEQELDIISSRNKDDKQKMYDINKILEKARYENKKVKEPENNILNNSRSILETLGTSDYESDFLTKKDKSIDKIDDVIETPVDKLEMTREMKYHTKNININPLINQVMPDNDLSLELLSDLKPGDNTIVTEPVKEKEIQKSSKIDKKKDDVKKDNDDDFFPMDLSDTSDIDIIKDTKEIDKDFFTSSYEFSRKDFTDDDDDDYSGDGSIIKIILLVVAICIILGGIAFFVFNYVLNK
ncbi:MAG: hypothetical protein VZS44_02855 [Bacilli bacterium]|nr:hypothetical protein [Bacilli bacterium]